ncbi:tautomerase family protein [Mycolicibacterium sp. A43C]
MPMIDLTLPEGSLSAASSSGLLDELATLLLRAERVPDTEFFREITWVYLHEVPPVAVGGRPGGTPRFRVGITVPEGALSQRRKEQLAADVYAAVANAAGFADNDARALHVWTIVTEVPDGNWSAGGSTIRFADLQQLATTEQDNLHG